MDFQDIEQYAVLGWINLTSFFSKFEICCFNATISLL